MQIADAVPTGLQRLEDFRRQFLIRHGVEQSGRRGNDQPIGPAQDDDRADDANDGIEPVQP